MIVLERVLEHRRPDDLEQSGAEQRPQSARQNACGADGEEIGGEAEVPAEEQHRADADYFDSQRVADGKDRDRKNSDDRKAAAKDLKIDSFDLMRAGGARVALRVGTDGSFNCIDYSTGEGGGSSCNSDYTKALTLTTRSADRVAGTFRLKAGADTADVLAEFGIDET